MSDAAKYPSRDWKKVLTLGILILISFLIIPTFLVLGYTFRALKWSIAGADELPDFDEWGSMFIEGIKVFAVQIVYFLVPILVMAFGLWASFGSLMTMQNTAMVSNPDMFIGIIGSTFILGMILMIIFGVFFTIALANMAYNNGELKSAFRLKEILDHIAKIGWVDYIVWYVMIIIIGTVFGFITGMLVMIPILGWVIIIIFVTPYIYLLYARALGLLFISGFENH